MITFRQDGMKILTINTGSSSLKFQLLEVGGDQWGTPSTRRLAYGKVISIGNDARCHFNVNGKAVIDVTCLVADHGEAV